jgi:phospholipid/cholesterol/gamma-HCH transport system substrate-binding protein
VANRYITLTPGPNNRRALSGGQTVPTPISHEVVDLDQLFNIFNPKTRKALQNVIQGTAQQYTGSEHALNVSTKYFSPAVSAADHIFAELSRDQQNFTSFLVETSKATSIIAAHKDQLSELIGNSNVAFHAIGSKQESLARGLRELPTTLNQGTKTFTNLSPTLSAFRRLIDVSKPDTKTLAPFFAKLRPLLTEATPVVQNFSAAIEQPGSNNDLTDAALALPGLAQALSTGSPDAVKSLQESVPVTAFFGPYTPDLIGLLRDFGQGTAYYDANGHYARVSPTFDSFKLGSNNTLTPVAPAQGLEGLKTGQLRRCPGSATQPLPDGSAPFTDEGKLSCDPSQVP